MAGYLLWSEVVPEAPQATSVVERLLLAADGSARARPRRARRHRPQVARGRRRRHRAARAAAGGRRRRAARTSRRSRSRSRSTSTCTSTWRAAGRSDALDDTADYGAVCDVAERVVTGTSYALLEALAEHLAAAVLAADARIDAVTVSVRKLRPPVPQQLSTSGVRITRGR